MSDKIEKALDIIYEWYERDVMANPTCKILIGFIVGSIVIHIFI